MSAGTYVNPAAVREGDKIATKFDKYTLRIAKTRTVQSAGFFEGKPENYHIDGECYDTRFSNVVVPLKK